MDKKIIEYVLIAIAIILLIYGGYFFLNYHYQETELSFDSITLRAPSSSQYAVAGDTIEFKNPTYSFYNLNLTKTTSSDARVKTLLKEYVNFKDGSVDYLNQSYYVVNVNFEERGFSNHAMIIPVDSFDKDNLSFTRNSTVFLFDANNREFVIDSAYNSQVVL